MNSLEQKVRFFWQRKGILNYLLLPLSAIYYLLFAIKKILTIQKSVDAYVICIGNLTVGGSGKTPLAAGLAKQLIAQNKKVAFISRGYKGSLSSKNALKVNYNKHTSTEVGDEPLLLSKIAPTYISKNRYVAAQMAKADGAEIIIMDDGLQNYSLKKNLIVITVDDYKFGNGMILPAGPLREPLSNLKQADIIANYTKFNIAKKGQKEIRLTTKISNLDKLKSNQYLAFCGIGNPKKFHKLLRDNKINLVNFFSFNDHHNYIDEEIENLIKTAKTYDARLLTTAKDLIKIPTMFHDFIDVVEIEVFGLDIILDSSFGIPVLN